MCTLSVVPTEEGYLAGMNRDEKLSRAGALRPSCARHGELTALSPREASGGTWIAGNDFGVLLALLNWHQTGGQGWGGKPRTRGSVIPQLIGAADLASMATRLATIRLDGMLPFRLIGVFRGPSAICEWRWDGEKIAGLDFPWRRKHWFSSSCSDQMAGRVRGAACSPGRSEPEIGRPEWLRELHRSHQPEPGPFSICVHRPDAATVSYTEVECDRFSISMRYMDGAPCLRPGFDSSVQLALRHSVARLALATCEPSFTAE